MARPVQNLPGTFYHANLTLANGVETQVVAASIPLRTGIWITLDNRDYRIAFAPGVLAGGGGLRLWRSDQRGTYFFPCADANLLHVASVGNNGRISLMAAQALRGSVTPATGFDHCEDPRTARRPDAKPQTPTIANPATFVARLLHTNDFVCTESQKMSHKAFDFFG